MFPPWSAQLPCEVNIHPSTSISIIYAIARRAYFAYLRYFLIACFNFITLLFLLRNRPKYIEILQRPSSSPAFRALFLSNFLKLRPNIPLILLQIKKSRFPGFSFCYFPFSNPAFSGSFSFCLGSFAISTSKPSSRMRSKYFLSAFSSVTITSISLRSAHLTKVVLPNLE